MKTSNQSLVDHPRLTCRVVQGWVSIMGDGAAPAPGTLGAQHVASCECCGRFFSHGRDLEASLRGAAAGRSALVTPGLEQRIIAAVGRSAREAQTATSERARPGFGMGALAWAGATASVALMILVFQPGRVTERSRPGPTTVPRTEDLADNAADLTPSDALGLWDTAPLQREAEAVYSDARSALGFLAMNFTLMSLDDDGGAPARPVPAVRPANG